MSKQADEVMTKLRSNPLYKKVTANLSEAERKQIESTVSDYVVKLTDSLSSIISAPGAVEAIREEAKKSEAKGS
jgi:hypothetical protein